MSLDDYTRGHTHRQHLAWVAWLKAQRNIPDRHDWYLMALTCEVRRILSKEPNRIKIKDFQLQFKEEKTEKPRAERTLEERQAEAMSFWKAALGGLPPRPPKGNHEIEDRDGGRLSS